MSNIPSSRSGNMAAIKSKNTVPEIKLRKILHWRGYRYRLHSTNLPGKPDLFMKKYNLAIFVNGCFWHRHKNCKYATTPRTRESTWLNKFEKNMERDKKNYHFLRRMGYRVLIIWECFLKENDDLEIFEKVEKGILSDKLYVSIKFNKYPKL